MDGGHGALSSEKAKRKEKVEIMGASNTIGNVEEEDNSSAAGGLSPGDIGANDEATDDFAKKIEAKIDAVLEKPPNYTASKNISSVPASTEDHVKKLYEPRAVAIGPYHRKGDNNFRITDEHKLWCVKEIIGDNYKQNLGKFLGKMKERETDARNFFDERYGKDILGGMDSQSFLEMLILDGCFICHALKLRHKLSNLFKHVMPVNFVPWAPRDMGRALELMIKTDLLLLNNQIPFFIIKDVFQMQNKVSEGNDSPITHALHLFSTLGLGRKGSISKKNGEVHHLLHLYYMYLEPPLPPPGKSLLEDISTVILVQIDPERYLPRATRLQRKSQVKFKKKKMEHDQEQSVLDVTTCKSGHIQMLALRVDGNTNIVLHNLIHFEQSQVIGNWYITAYVAFMYHIVQSEEDVELLEDREVLQSRLSGPAEVVALFRQLHNVIDHSMTPGYLAKVYEEATVWYGDWRRRMHADAMERYCSTVWGEHHGCGRNGLISSRPHRDNLFHHRLLSKLNGTAAGLEV